MRKTGYKDISGTTLAIARQLYTVCMQFLPKQRSFAFICDNCLTCSIAAAAERAAHLPHGSQRDQSTCAAASRLSQSTVSRTVSEIGRGA